MLHSLRRIPTPALAWIAAAIVVLGLGRVRADEVLPATEELLPGLKPILAVTASQSPRMITENLARLEAEYQADAARAQLYPTAAGYTRYLFQSENRISDNTSSAGVKSFYQFEIAQPVFHWGSLKADADLNRIRQDIAERNYSRAYRTLANEIRSTYLSLIIDKLEIRNARSEVERLKKRLELVRQRVAEGSDVAGTVTSLELSMDDAILGLERRESALSFRLRQFKWLTGLNSFSVDQLPETIPQVPGFDAARPVQLRTEYVTSRGYESDPRYANSQREIDIQKLSLKILKNTLKPKFNLVVGANQDEIDRTGNVENKYQVQALYAGVSMNWTIFDSFRSRANTRAAQTRLRQKERALAQVEEELLRTLEQAEADLGFAVRALRLAEIRWTGSNSGLIAAIEFEKQGRSSSYDVDVARAGMLAAEVTVCRARASCLTAVTAFNTAMNADPFIATGDRAPAP